MAVRPSRSIPAAALLVLLLFGASSGIGTELHAQTLQSGFSPVDTYRIVEKHNFRKRENGSYLGGVYREVRGLLHRTSGGVPPSAPPESSVYEGRFFLLEETKRAARLAAARVDESLSARLVLGPSGVPLPGSLGRFPTMRGFPAFPADPVPSGGGWQAFGERVLDPDFSGAITPVKVYVDYRYEGPTTYRGEKGSRITGKYAVRFKRGRDSGGDPGLDEVSGTHDLSIFISDLPGGLRLISETFKEIYKYNGGRTLSLEGAILTFFEGILPLDRPKTAEELRGRIASGVVPEPETESSVSPSSAIPLPGSSPVPAGDLPDIEVSSRPEGVALTINNLRFKADSANLLPGESSRLDSLARALAAIPDRSFLVVGHTADVGRPEGEKSLSLERAKAVVDGLSARGIDAGRFLYEGRGGTEPVAPNTAEDGRAKNRRVEILILED